MERDQETKAQPVAPGRGLEALAGMGNRVSFDAGRLVGVQGQSCDRLYLIVEGHVLLSRYRLNDGEYSLYILGPGGLFGVGSLLQGSSWLVTAQALTDGVGHVIPASNLPRLIQNRPEFAVDLIILLGERLERAYRRLDLTSTHTARERVLGLLDLMAHYHGTADDEGMWIPLLINQSVLCGMVGLTRESIGRTLAKLEEENLIRRKGREGIWLKRTAVSGG